LFVKELLERNGLWSRIEGKFIQAKSGDEAVSKIILRSVDATISWHVFYYWNIDKLDIVWIDPLEIYKVSVIPAAITIYAKDKTLCEIFLDFITHSQISKNILRKYKILLLI